MAEVAYFFDGVSYSEAAQADFQARAMRPQGVFGESSYGALVVTATNGNLSVTVGAGEAMVQGFYYRNDAPKVLAIAANASGSTRIDTVVLRLNRTANTLIAAVLQGTPGAGAPALTQIVGGTWELAIANITVPNNAASIVAGNVADVRTYSRWAYGALAIPIIAKGSVSNAIPGTFTLTNAVNVASVTYIDAATCEITLSVPTKNTGGVISYQVIVTQVSASLIMWPNVQKISSTVFRVILNNSPTGFDFIVID